MNLSDKEYKIPEKDTNIFGFALIIKYKYTDTSLYGILQKVKNKILFVYRASIIENSASRHITMPL